MTTCVFKGIFLPSEASLCSPQKTRKQSFRLKQGVQLPVVRKTITTSYMYRKGESTSFQSGVTGLDSVTKRHLLLSTLTLGCSSVFAGASLSAGSVRDLTRSGMQKFTKGDVEGSIEDFDKILELSPKSRPYLWQRGISLYYADRFEEGGTQFRDDVAVNPNDTEESIWAYLCDARLYGPAEAEKRLLKVGRDPRPVMRAAYEVFSGRADISELEKATGADNGGSDRFYSELYQALWYEAQDNVKEAEYSMLRAVSTPYAKNSGDYMAALAKVHCLRRGWNFRYAEY